MFQDNAFDDPVTDEMVSRLARLFASMGKIGREQNDMVDDAAAHLSRWRWLAFVTEYRGGASFDRLTNPDMEMILSHAEAWVDRVFIMAYIRAQGSLLAKADWGNS